MATIETGLANGVSFALTDEQRELRSLAREFAEKEIRPKAAEYDEHQTHPADVVAKAHELGLMNLHVPESLGGPELSAFDGMLVGEELNWGCSGIGTSIGANGLAAGPILIAGTDEQKREWLAPLVSEPILGCFGLSEPGAGSDVSGIQTTAVAKGDDYIVNGSKMFITNAGKASWMVCFASTDKSKGHRGPDGVRDRNGRRGRHDREAPRQDGPARDRHLGRGVPGRRRALGEPPRRGGRRLQDRDADARLHAPRHGGRRGRRRAGGVRARRRLREGARPVRDADRDEPGRLVPHRRHGGRDRGGAPAHLAGGVDDRPGLRPQGDEVLLLREALRRRHGDEGDHRRRAGLRRIRLHQGVPGREAHARREALPDLRGHVADPAPRDREGDLPRGVSTESQTDPLLPSH